MRFLLFTCILLLTNISTYANIPAEIINTSILIEVKPTKNTQKILKKNKKQPKQLRKQNRKLKWQLLKNAIKAQKMNKVKNKKDKKPIYWASWTSFILALAATVMLYYFMMLGAGLLWGLFIASVAVGILAFIVAFLSIRFLKKHKESLEYNEKTSFALAYTAEIIGFAFLLLLLIIISIPLVIVY